MEMHDNIKFCSACNSLFVPGLNCTVRIIPITTDSSPEIWEHGKGQLPPFDMRSKNRISTFKIPGIKPRIVTLNLKSSNSQSQPPSQKDKNAQLEKSQLPVDSQESKHINPNNIVVYLCHVCSCETRMPGSLPNHLPRQSLSITSSKRRKINHPNSMPIQNATSKSTETKSKPSTARSLESHNHRLNHPVNQSSSSSPHASKNTVPSSHKQQGQPSSKPKSDPKKKTSLKNLIKSRHVADKGYALTDFSQ